MSIELVAPSPIGWPEWVDQTEFRVRDGRDPLGLETITTDRIVPRLVPAVLALSGRARYFSFHLFLLDEFARRRLAPTPENQSTFFRLREFEYGAAVLLCPRCGQSAAPVGSQTLRAIVRRAKDQIVRGFSVDSDLGGYGLYYSSPLRDLGLVHRRGTEIGGEVLPVDVLAGGRAQAIADAFRKTIEHTDYFQHHFMGEDPIPVDVLRDFAETGCLCRLNESADEVRLLRAAFFDELPGQAADDVRRRREAFALRLRLAQETPAVLTNEAVHRQATLSALESTTAASTPWSDTVQRWAALYGKEYYQEGLRALWGHVNRYGRNHCPVEGLAPAMFLEELREEVATADMQILGRRFSVKKNEKTADVIERARTAVGDVPLENLREWAVAEGTCLAGMLLLLALIDRLPVRDGLPVDAPWYQVAREGGNNQPGLFGFAAQLRQHLASDPEVADTIVWLVRRFILGAHDRIASGKLPDFTFRFRIEAGRLRFFSQPSIDFGLADSRYNALSSLAADLGLWQAAGGAATVTTEGQALVKVAFG